MAERANIGDIERASPEARAGLIRALHGLPGSLGPEHLASFGEESARLAARHNLLAAIAAARSPQASLEPEAEDLIRKTRLRSGFQAERVRRGWERALNVLEQAGVRALPLKGRSLALRLYGDASIRLSSDVDVLVAREDYERAIAALQGAAYVIPVWVKPRYYLKGHHHVLVAAPDRLPPLELHFALSSDLGGGLDSGAVMARARCERVGGREVLVMEPEDEFVYLATHAAIHAFAPLVLLLDLKMLAAKGLDARRLWTRAVEGEVTVALSIALAIAERWTGLKLDVPESRSLRATLMRRALFPDVRVAEASYSPDRHKYAAWVPAFALTDRMSRAMRSFAKNFARGAKRHTRKRLGRWVPEEWGD